MHENVMHCLILRVGQVTRYQFGDSAPHSCDTVAGQQAERQHRFSDMTRSKRGVSNFHGVGIASAQFLQVGYGCL